MTASKLPVEVIDVAADRGRGNLLGIQPWVTPADYRSQVSFHDSMRTLFRAAHGAGFLVPQKTIAVLPEYVGTWLALIDEPAPAGWNLHSAISMLAVIARNRRSFARALNQARSIGVREHYKYALFAMKSPEMARAYDSVFSSLAREFEVTLIAGSIVLQNPTIEKDRLVVRPGPLYNSTVVYRPDGSPHPRVTRKVFPVRGERGFTSAGELCDQGAYKTADGVTFKTLNCADAWFPQSYQHLSAAGVEAVVVFSYLVKAQAWKRPWMGYPDDDRRFAPPDVDWTRRGAISEEEAWDTWGPLARLPADVPQLIKVVLRGRLWELGAEGTTTVINRRVGNEPRKLRYASDHPYAGLASSWL